MSSLIMAYLLGIGCFGLLALATLGTDRLTPTRPEGEEEHAS